MVIFLGKFDGILFASDFDKTLTFSPPDNHFDISVSAENQAAIRHFTEQGGTFIVASGRGHCTFSPFADSVPFNGPCVLANGAEIYDFAQERDIHAFPIPPSAKEHLRVVQELLPAIAFEMYCPNDEIYLVHPNEVSRAHLKFTPELNTRECELDEVPNEGWFKVLIEGKREDLQQAKDLINRRWGDEYECIFSNDTLLELNKKGVTKAESILWVADYLGIAHECICCIGDNENDYSMLKMAAIAFAPDNAVPQVKTLPGLHYVPHHNEHAVAAALAELETLL